MQKKAMTDRRRRQPAHKLIHVAVWALALLAVSAPASIWMAEDPLAPQAEVNAACLEYQDPDTLDLEKEFVHPALDEGCTACHTDCDTVSPASDIESDSESDSKTGSEYYLNTAQPGLCLECHSELHPDLEEAHDNQPLDQSRCSSCHDAHASNMPKRLPDFSHGPYDARLCSACHPEPADGNVELVETPANALCYGCHTDIRMRIEGAKRSHGLLAENDRSCMDCHDPHAAGQAFMLTQPVYGLCIDCHEGKPEEAPTPKQKPKPSRSSGMPSLDDVMQTDRYSNQQEEEGSRLIDLSLEHVHEPVRQSCTLCHDAHASEFAAELKAPVYDLCMECHGENAEEILNSEEPFPFLDGLVSLPPKIFDELPYLDLNTEYIHEPVRQSCLYCHDAHVSENTGLLYEPAHNLCIGCHDSGAVRSIMQSDRQFRLFGGRVTLPPRPFEGLHDIRLVNSNSEGHPMQGHPVYVPATEEEPGFNCLSCHISHASTTGLRRWKYDTRDEMCLECHKF